MGFPQCGQYLCRNFALKLADKTFNYLTFAVRKK